MHQTSWAETIQTAQQLIAGVCIAAFLLGVRFRSRRREWQHLERMKSLEMGVPLPAQPGRGLVAIGAGVPIASIGFAFLTTLLLMVYASDPIHRGNENIALSIPILGIIWGAAISVSCFALVIALILGVIQSRAQNNAYESNAWTGTHAKPVFDPESYEFSGHQS